ncbi:MAG TPA: DUF2779 domain-containing protein [Coriobacteriia bacterium]|nr:DUF2779 domain-containing protein [Coriobacteriia bacterium]
MSTRLSKSRFQKGLQCEKALWLAVHAPQLADQVSEARQWIFDQGAEVGRLAHGLVPGGVEVTEDHLHAEQALQTTARLLAEGASVLYEPALRFDNILVRVDILAHAGDGTWDLYEVKSSASLKPEHVTDAAVQTYVAQGAGLRVRRSLIVRLDRSYVYDGGEHDPRRLFAVEDITADVREFLPQVPEILARFRTMLAGPEPPIRIGARCRTPYECDFSAHCHAALSCEHPVTGLPFLSDRTLNALLDLGVLSIRDIPEGFPMLSANQNAIARVVKSGLPRVDTDGLARQLGALAWPVYHLDFETVMPALPLWPGMRPYQMAPFQYSVHVHREDGSCEHREYLHSDTSDPRRPLAERLLADLGDSGSVIHYTSFERKRLVELAEALPDLAEAFSAVISRLVDLEPIIKRHTLHPATSGRTSIKAVLPAWCPDLSYDGLAIGDGNTASVRYLRSLKEPLPPDETERLHADLREYCGLDTLAMVHLLETLRAHARR